jgi:predicted TIM-barrel fold metal-dependent hydrolase
MIIDIHTHIFAKAVRERREDFFQGEPTFELLYRSPKSRLIGADELVAMMDEAGVDKAVTFGFPWRSADTFRRNNDEVLDAVARYPGRLIGFGCVDPLHPGAPAEVERCLAAGLAGIGELAFYDSDLDDRCLDSLDPIMALAGQFDVPVMLHTNEPVGHLYPGKAPNTLARIYALVRRYPESRLILAHWGGGLLFYALLKKEVRQVLANVWFDTAASPYLYRPEIYTVAADIVGADKILFGTDYPLLGPKRYWDEMREAGLSAERMERIRGRNALELFKLG